MSKVFVKVGVELPSHGVGGKGGKKEKKNKEKKKRKVAEEQEKVEWKNTFLNTFFFR